MTRRLALAASVMLLVACGGSEPAPEEGAATTAGGETEEERAVLGALESEPEPPRAPVVLRTTVPVPVPQPAVPRDELSAPLEAVWTAVEEQVAIARPDGPEPSTLQTVQAWADGPFREWIQRRREAIDATRPLLEEVAADPTYERAVALALWAYAFEDFWAQVAGAPVPEEVARDRELRDIYIDSLNAASLPLGRRAIELYADCQQRLASLGDDSPWLPWRAYCVQRGQEVIEGYGLAPASAEGAPAEAGD